MPRKRIRKETSTDIIEGVILWPALLGCILRQLRMKIDISQIELSRHLDWPQSQLSKVESGEVMTTVEHLMLIVARLNDLRRAQRPVDGIRFTPWYASELLANAEDIALELGKKNYHLKWVTVRVYPDTSHLVLGDQLDGLVSEIRTTFR